MSQIDINGLIGSVLVNSVPKEWMAQMPVHMMSVAASDVVLIHGYAKAASLLRDLADIIENTGMKLEFHNGN